MTLLCAAPHCGLPRRHLPDCPQPEACRGCQPARAADGLRLCAHCTRRVGEDAVQSARLHADLAAALIAERRGERSTGSAVGAPVPDEEVIELRDAARGVLVALAGHIARQRGLRLPPMRAATTVRRTLRRYDGSTITDDDGRAVVRTYSYPVPPLASLARFVADHAMWLAAQPEAGDTAADLRAVAGNHKAYAMAYRCGPDRLYVGDCPLLVRSLDGEESVCGQRLYQYPDAPLIQCGGCGTEETVEQWQRWLVPAGHGVVDAYAAAADLSLRWCRPVDPALIRQWSSRGRITPVTEPDPTDHQGQRVRPARDRRGRTLYVLEDLRGYARSIWGDEPVLRRAGAR